jgi:hypothetical protein
MARSLPLAAFHILLAVADRERHGYAIMQDVLLRTDGRLRLGTGNALRLDQTSAGRWADRGTGFFPQRWQ